MRGESDREVRMEEREGERKGNGSMESEGCSLGDGESGVKNV